jgi:hypothetical protein
VNVVINEHFFEVMCSKTPVLLEVQDEVRGNNLATTIAHESSSVQFPHKGIHDRHICLTIFPFDDYL